jgi:tight adherence protein B
LTLLYLAAILAALSLGFVAFYLARRLGPGGAIEEEKLMKERMSARGKFGAGDVSRIRKRDVQDEAGVVRGFFKKHRFYERFVIGLSTAKINTSVTKYLLLCLFLGVISFIVLQVWFGFLPRLLISLLLGASPLLYVYFRRKFYVAKFAENLPNGLSSISGSIKAGRSLEAAFETAAQTAPYPVADEFKQVRAEMGLGVPMQQALTNLYQRIRNNHELKILITGISIHQELGGNLSEILDNLERTIRDRFAMKRELSTLSAQGKISIWVLVGIPIFLMLFFFKSNPEQFASFIHSSQGENIIWAVIVLNAVGFFWMSRVIRLGD